MASAAVELDAVKSMSRAGKAALEKDAADMVEIQRQARGRLLGDWSDRTAAPKRAEVPEEPKVKRVPGLRPAMLPHGEMAGPELREAARKRASDKRYGWQTALANLAGVSISVLKRVRMDVPVSVAICEKVVAVPFEALEAAVARIKAERRAA